MERSQRTGSKRGRTAPKIIAIAEFVNEHRDAIEYDLMTRTIYTLSDVGRSLSWGALASFIKYLGEDSATAREINKEVAGWESTLKTNTLLADIYDLLQVVNANIVAHATNGKHKQRVKPYPRPGAEDKDTRRIGHGALPVDDLREWIRSKQHG